MPVRLRPDENTEPRHRAEPWDIHSPVRLQGRHSAISQFQSGSEDSHWPKCVVSQKRVASSFALQDQQVEGRASFESSLLTEAFPGYVAIVLEP
jgi:hypothetical protein